ncbi:hypothetical protein M7I_4465 [Glarea lozoyensis 74030]|uniref:Uncharacterized protein n=1 Tax=Glarea lozoyensis (strain ATCC 74030 / MF5533) TaxID=1104152 RepID=H0EP94_GLAL7|nr:hypothetical protein M7I_4465 [Glarea lozoyensis 74030]
MYEGVTPRMHPLTDFLGTMSFFALLDRRTGYGTAPGEDPTLV